jgi:hypothetical protein
MTCTSAEAILNAYADGELGASDMKQLELHLAECQRCQQELDEIRRLDFQIRSEIEVPVKLQSLVADRLETAKRGSSGLHLKEVLRMKTRWGLAAIAAAGLIVVGVMSTGGRAQATLSKMHRAVTEVHSSHLRVELERPMDFGITGQHHDADGVSNLLGSAKFLDVWSEGNKWKAQIFGGIEAIYNDGDLSVVMGSKVMAKVHADREDVPQDMGDYLFRELSKATAELREHAKVRSLGVIRENGKTLQTLEVTQLKDEGKDFRMLYWVDTETDLPARFQVFTTDENGHQSLMATITCEFNEDYPDTLFIAGADKP